MFGRIIGCLLGAFVLNIFNFSEVFYQCAEGYFGIQANIYMYYGTFAGVGIISYLLHIIFNKD